MPNVGTLGNRDHAQYVLFKHHGSRRKSAAMATDTNLRQLREARGLSQSALAEKIGTTLNMYGKLERGTRRLNMDWLRKLADALGVGRDDIVAEIEAEDEAEGYPHPTIEAVSAMISEHYQGVTGAPIPDEMLSDLAERVFDSIVNWKGDPAAARDPQVARSVARQINRRFDR